MDRYKYQRQYYLKNREKIIAKRKLRKDETNAYARERRKKLGQKYNDYLKEYRTKRRLKILKHYGGDMPECACCKENQICFLSIDHINGGGTKHRKEIGQDLDGWLIRNNYPEEFQVLCHNCNFAKGNTSFCPHQISSL